MSNANLHFHLFTKAKIFLKNSACRYISLGGQWKRNSKALIDSFLQHVGVEGTVVHVNGGAQPACVRA